MTYKSEDKDGKCYLLTRSYLREEKVLMKYATRCGCCRIATSGTQLKNSEEAALQKNFKKRIVACRFYRAYIRLFTEDTLLEAEYISQQNVGYRKRYDTEQERLCEARRLVGKYAKAGLVVTSRIHCALPCLGLETPVILTETVASRRNMLAG